MDKQQKIQLIIELFNFYMAGITKRKYTINLRDTEMKTVEKFIKGIGKDFGQSVEAEEWFYGYFEYQFNYWYTIEKTGKMTVKWYYLRPSWIVGPKAYKRYGDYKKRFDFIPKRKIRKLLRVEEHFKSPLEKKAVMTNQPKPFEEKEKERFFDTDAALEWCISSTTLFHPKSTFCRKCKQQLVCKSTLKKNYPKLSKRRLDEKT